MEITKQILIPALRKGGGGPCQLGVGSKSLGSLINYDVRL